MMDGTTQKRARIINAFRSDEMPEAFMQTLSQQLDLGIAIHIELTPLNQQDSERLIKDLGISNATEIASRMYTLSGGNPQFMLELVRTYYHEGEVRLADVVHVPPAVKFVIEERLKRLSGGALRLARMLAVLQHDSSLEALAQLLELTHFELVDYLDELERAFLFRHGRFVHDLALEATLQATPDLSLQAFHRQAALFLEQQGEQVARVAHHYLQANSPLQAHPKLLQATQEAITMGAFEQAGIWLRQLKESTLTVDLSSEVERLSNLLLTKHSN